MNDFLKLVQEFWVVLTMLATGVGSFLAWRQKKKNEEKTSASLLFEQLEKLKKKIIIQVNNEIEHAKSNAEKEKIIFMLRTHCPDCYNAVILKMQTDEQNT